ncbi:glutathione S-transferase [Ceraceosorus guamensis]|uniref:Glutathione S-transferase n=1 Tax=Ceraceosorus guamensis TaxID=1522189 RepID=A0A316VZZ9_9BASI|nr:glutathione S-transferase [Ceraceosorus guamensis]PWN43166.1 glutathione S-transferase [Ceraceosorus guamensis]
MAQFTLYSHKGPGPNPLKVAILLEKLGLSYDVVPLVFGPGDGQNEGVKGEKFLKVNPNGRVPALVDHQNSDFTIWESGAILLYLIDKYGQDGSFGGKTPEERAVVNQWFALQLSTFGPQQGQVNWEATYGEKPQKSVFTRYEGEVARLYTLLNDQLEAQSKRGSSFVALERPTVADIAFYPWVNIAGFGKIDLAPYPAVGKWHAALAADADVKKAQAALS